MNRRDLIQKIVLGGTTLIVVPSVLTSCSKEDGGDNGGNGGTPANKLTIDLTAPAYTALNAAGGFVVVSSKNIIVANAGNNAFIALSSVCTHDGCTISYNAASNNFPCGCHGSVFSTTGSVLNGPAVTAVKSHTVNKVGNTLEISL